MRGAALRLACHRIPDRCFHWRGRPIPLCARCLGCLIGQVVACAVLMLGGALPWQWCVGLVGVLGIDWSAQQYLGFMSTNVRRLLTGVAGGVGATGLYLQAAGFLLGRLACQLLFGP